MAQATGKRQSTSVFTQFLRIVSEAARKWNKDNAPRLGAALSYYTVFSLAPLLVVATAIAGLVFGKEAVRGEIASQIQGLIGAQGAKTVEDLIANAWRPSAGIIATIVGVIGLLIGGTAVFSELRSDLNQIWNVPPRKTSGLWAFVKDKLLSFAMMASIGFLLLVSLIANTVLAIATKFFSGIVPIPGISGQILFSLLSFFLVSVLFAFIFKVLPEAKIEWRDVWIGAVITTFFFSVGKFLIGLYLGQAIVTSAYGASGSLAIVLLWAYYSSLIVIFGAEFTQVYATHRANLA